MSKNEGFDIQSDNFFGRTNNLDKIVLDKLTPKIDKLLSELEDLGEIGEQRWCEIEKKWHELLPQLLDFTSIDVDKNEWRKFEQKRNRLNKLMVETGTRFKEQTLNLDKHYIKGQMNELSERLDILYDILEGFVEIDTREGWEEISVELERLLREMTRFQETAFEYSNQKMSKSKLLVLKRDLDDLEKSVNRLEELFQIIKEDYSDEDIMLLWEKIVLKRKEYESLYSKVDAVGDCRHFSAVLTMLADHEHELSKNESEKLEIIYRANEVASKSLNGSLNIIKEIAELLPIVFDEEVPHLQGILEYCDRVDVHLVERKISLATLYLELYLLLGRYFKEVGGVEACFKELVPKIENMDLQDLLELFDEDDKYDDVERSVSTDETI